MGTQESYPTLELVIEKKIYKLLDEFSKKDRVEASGIVRVHDHFYVVFDDDSRIAKINCDLSANGNSLVGIEINAYGFEGITYNPNKKVFYALIESQKAFNKAKHFAYVNEYNQDFNLLNNTRLEYEFSSTKDEYNKGFEGISFLQREEHNYLLCLCEGNLCRGNDLGKEPGYGIIHAFKRKPSVWEHAAAIKIPNNVMFVDYSGMDISGNIVAIVSQRSSLLWVGTLMTEKWEFLGQGKIYQFPMADNGEMIYGNVEGVAWISPSEVVVVSDAKKKNGHFEQTDQSIHIFKIPS